MITRAMSFLPLIDVYLFIETRALIRESALFERRRWGGAPIQAYDALRWDEEGSPQL